MASSSTFSGSALPSGSATNQTWLSIVTDISAAIGDTTHDDSIIARWINQGVRDYSQHFPRIKTQTITTTADLNTYNLNSDFTAVLSVEYPTGQDPQEYLSRLTYTHPDFWGSDSFYDIVRRSDGTDQDELWISKDPATAESIEVTYHAHHEQIANVGAISGNTTIPHNHIHLLTLYVQWQNAHYLANAEQQSPTSNSSLLMAQLSQNARRYEAAYHTALRQALYASSGSRSQPVQWIQTGDPHARIY